MTVGERGREGGRDKSDGGKRGRESEDSGGGGFVLPVSQSLTFLTSAPPLNHTMATENFFAGD